MNDSDYNKQTTNRHQSSDDSRETNSSESLTDRAMHKAEGAARAVKERTRYLAERGLEKGTDAAGNRVDSVADSISEISDTLRQENAASAAHYVDLAAERVDRVGRYLHECDPQEVLSDIAGYAKRHPEVVLTAAVAGGLLLGRFLKSSSESRRVDHEAAKHYRAGREDDSDASEDDVQRSMSHRRMRARKIASSGLNRRPVSPTHYQRRETREFPSSDRDSMGNSPSYGEKSSMSSSSLMPKSSGNPTELSGGLEVKHTDRGSKHAHE